MRGTIFISCGQSTAAEKALGKQIVEMVRAQTDLEPFFAEEVQDLNGLDANILDALRSCAGFITILHPRGEIGRPDGSVLVRESVWIEQEIAIATYIQRHEKRALPIIAFKHRLVGREGIRDLLHLNPIEFTDESEVLEELPRRLLSWNSLKPSSIELELFSEVVGQQEGHQISRVVTALRNESNNRIDKYDLELRLPASILTHWSASYPNEVRSNDPGIRCFRFDRSGWGSVGPHDRRRLAAYEYCTSCAVGKVGGVSTLIAEAKLGARIWVDGKEYSVEKTIKQLAAGRE